MQLSDSLKKRIDQDIEKTKTQRAGGLSASLKNKIDQDIAKTSQEFSEKNLDLAMDRAAPTGGIKPLQKPSARITQTQLRDLNQLQSQQRAEWFTDMQGDETTVGRAAAEAKAVASYSKLTEQQKKLDEMQAQQREIEARAAALDNGALHLQRLYDSYAANPNDVDYMAYVAAYEQHQKAVEQYNKDLETVKKNTAAYAGEYSKYTTLAQQAQKDLAEYNAAQQAYDEAHPLEFGGDPIRQKQYMNYLDREIEAAEQKLTGVNAMLGSYAASGSERGQELEAEKNQLQQRLSKLRQQKTEVFGIISGAEKAEQAAQYNSLTREADFAQFAELGKQYLASGKAPAAVGESEAMVPVNLKLSAELNYDEMTEEEKNIYAYLLGKQGAVAAREYLDFLEENLNLRRGQKTAEAVRGMEHGVPRALASGAYAFMSGVETFGSDFETMITGDVKPKTATQVAGELIRQDIQQDGKKVGGVLYDLLYNAANAAPSMLVGGIPGLSLLGTSAAGGAKREALQAGYNKRQANAYGIMVGVSEATISGALSGMANLGGKITNHAVKAAINNIDNAFLKVAAKVGINMAGEGVEEYLQEILNPVYRNIFLGEENEIKAYTEEAMYAFLLGALSSAGTNVIAEGSRAAADQTVGRHIKKGSRTDEILDRALSMEGTKSQEMAQQIRAKDKKESAGNLGELVRQMFADGYTAAEFAGDIALTKPETEQPVGVKWAGSDPDTLSMTGRLTGEEANISAEDYAQAERISKVTGREIVLYRKPAGEEGVEDGFYDRSTGKIYVNVESPKSQAHIVAHELTHSTELAESYGKLSRLVLDRIRAEGGNLRELREEKRSFYARNGIALESDTEADQEIVAEYIADHLLTDETSITELVQQDRGLAEKLVSWFDKLLAAFGNEKARERVFIQNARNLYAKALEESQGRHDRLQEIEQAREQLRKALNEGEISDAEFDEAMEAIDQQAEEYAAEGVQGSFGGKQAKTANLEALKTAKKMDERGAEAETIRRATGWFKGADGEWRFEIDDSKMQLYRGGDAVYRTRHPNYAEYRALQVRQLEEFGMETWTVADQARLKELNEIYRNEPARLRDNLRNGMARLGDILQHKDLFAAYPELENASVIIKNTSGGETGSYNPNTNTIVISESVWKNPESTLIHEIQHAIQKAEGFSGGANVRYWESRLREEDERAYEEASERRRELFDSLPGDLKNRIREKNRAELDDDWDTVLKIDDELRNSEHSELYEEYDDAVWEVQAAHARMTDSNRDYSGMAYDRYYNTAGEIEARDAARRRNMSAEQRRETMPDTGNENTVFVEQNVSSSDFVGWTAEGNEVYQTSAKTMSMSTNDRIQQFKTNYVQQFKGRTAKFERNGHTYYARFSEKSSELGKLTHEGSSHSSKSSERGYKAKIRMLADGNLFELVEDAQYDDTAKEIGKTSRSHTLAKFWDYFIKTIVVDGKAYDVLISVRLDSSSSDWSDKQHYVYSIRFRDNNTVATSIASPASSKVRRQGDIATDGSSLTYPFFNVNTQFSVSEMDADAAGTKAAAAENESSLDTEAPARMTKERADEIVAELPAKARDVLGATERHLVNKLGIALSVPKYAQREFLADLVRQISGEVLETGTVRQQMLDELFETAYEQGVVVDREFYDRYKDIKDYLRTTPLQVSDQIRGDIADFDAFRRSAFGNLRMVNSGGQPADVMYMELRNMAPELFPFDIQNPSDQVLRMFEAAKSIRVSEMKLDQAYGHEAENFKRWTRVQFEADVNELLGEIRNVKRYADDKKTVEREAKLQTQAEVEEAYKELKEAKRNYERTFAKALLTSHDEMLVGRLLRGEIEPGNLDPVTDNVDGITKVYAARKEYDRWAKKIAAWNAARKEKLRADADEMLVDSLHWRDKKAGWMYSRETMERNIRDIVPDQELAQRIIDHYFAPVHEAVAAATRMKNDYRQRVKNLNLSRKVEKGNAVSEAHAVQLLGEAMDNIRVLEANRRLKERDGKTLEEWNGVIAELWNTSPNLDQKKVEGAVETFREIYNELFEKMNDARVRNGYEPINYRQGYFPHFQPKQTGLADAFGKAMGIEMNVTALPTTINGMTHTFKPGIQWFGNAQERLGFNTAYDAVEGFDRYIEGSASVINTTDSIQRLRALASQIRFNTTTEQIRKQIMEIRQRTDISEAEKETLKKEIEEKAPYALSNFVVELDEYINLLANKKSKYDRTVESLLGRKFYNVAKAVESRVAANMVGLNPGSWLTNFIPLTQADAALDRGMLLRGMWQTMSQIKTKDGLSEMSAFLTNRRGSDPLVRTWTQKASAVTSKPMEWIDTFVSESIVRARYLQNIKAGLSEESAMRDADAFAANVIADRSKGAMPTIFEAKNPLVKLLTQYQLEVNNQLSYLFKDLPAEAKARKSGAIAVMLLKFGLEAWLYNEIYEFFIGRRPALDPISMLLSTAEELVGFDVPNLIELITGEDRDFSGERTGVLGAGKKLAEDIGGNTPFVGGLLFDGGRLPISSAMPNVANLVTAATDTSKSGRKRIQMAIKELEKPLVYWALPFAGGQLKKIYQGITAVIRGGSYTVDNEGNDVLQYPIYRDSIGETTWNTITAVLFGKSSTKTGREWVENEFKSFSAAETACYQGMVDAGAGERQAFEFLSELKRVQGTENESKQELQKEMLQNAQLSGAAKSVVYYSLFTAERDGIPDRKRELMDELAETADMGTVTEALLDLDAAETARVKRNIIADAELTEDEKLTMYRYIMGSRDEETGAYLLPEDVQADLAVYDLAGLGLDQYVAALDTKEDLSDEYEDSADRELEFYRWVSDQGYTARQAEAVRGCFWSGTGTKYDEFVAAGIADRTAYKMAKALKQLTPLPGETRVTAMQKYEVVVNSGLPAAQQMSAMAEVMTAAQYKKLEIAYDYSIPPAVYVEFARMVEENEAGTADEIKKLLKSIGTSTAGALQWGGGLSLTKQQKAALWQIFVSKSTEGGKNPFDRSVGREIYELRSADE